MPVNRFYLKEDLTLHSTVVLKEAEHHHLAHVIRLRSGDTMELVNGQGSLAEGTILEVEKKSTSIKITSTTYAPDLFPQFSLAIPLMRPSKLEWIVEKGTELGACSFLFYTADHSEKEALSHNQLERLHTLIISALKQSGRRYLPSLEILPSLSDLFLKDAFLLFGDPHTHNQIPAPKEKKLTIFITGPERGFSSKEQSLLDTRAAKVSLSPHTLRAETAPIAAASILGRLQTIQIV